MEVINTKKRVNTEFARAFYSVPAMMTNDLQDEIMKELEWSLATFYSKRNGNRKLHNPELIMLKSLFQKYGIEF